MPRIKEIFNIEDKKLIKRVKALDSKDFSIEVAIFNSKHPFQIRINNSAWKMYYEHKDVHAYLDGAFAVVKNIKDEIKKKHKWLDEDDKDGT